eukprot:NODE_2197_length_627_cov_352.662000_g2147_i0.p1 GENE.NODE_2197_length_627_cov_352.662000_g2147_i0~~NODE_2197_length_627_cov_352.662000_g2147_i0.p1  ORF type:complete len:157 (-),score=52.94 NODE_2197_length_627_cov_352.662000_g2147_i0:78-548(-)
MVKPEQRKERTFIAIKPDGVQRGAVGDIISRFEKKGLKLIAMKMVKISKEHAEKHYEDLKTKPFFGGLVEFVCSGPMVAMAWEGFGAARTGRMLLGETDPQKSLPGTIRGDWAIDLGRNICHGSDSAESGQKEIALWFKPEELVEWGTANETWIYE